MNSRYPFLFPGWIIVLKVWVFLLFLFYDFVKGFMIALLSYNLANGFLESSFGDE